MITNNYANVYNGLLRNRTVSFKNTCTYREVHVRVNDFYISLACWKFSYPWVSKYWHQCIMKQGVFVKHCAPRGQLDLQGQGQCHLLANNVHVIDHKVKVTRGQCWCQLTVLEQYKQCTWCRAQGQGHEGSTLKYHLTAFDQYKQCTYYRSQGQTHNGSTLMSLDSLWPI